MELSIGMYVTLIVIGVISSILSVISISCSIKAIIDVKALNKSTHSIQYVPMDPEIDKANEEYLNTKEWATKEENLEKQRNMFKEELEDKLEEFSLSDEDKEVIAF